MPEESPLQEYPVFQTWEEFRDANTAFMEMTDEEMDEDLVRTIAASAEVILQTETRMRVRDLMIKTKLRCSRLARGEQTKATASDTQTHSFGHLVNGARPQLGSTQSQIFSLKKKRGHGGGGHPTGDFTGYGLLAVLCNQQNSEQRINILLQWADVLEITPTVSMSKRAEIALEECFPFADEIAEQEQNKNYGKGPSPLSACRSIARHALMMIMTNVAPEGEDPTAILSDAIRERVIRSLASGKRAKNSQQKYRRRQKKKGE